MSADLREALTTMRRVIACDPRDWAVVPRDAWLFGVVCGWDEASDEIAERHPDIDMERMARFHTAIEKAMA